MIWHQQGWSSVRRCTTLSYMTTTTRSFRLDTQLDRRIDARAAELGSTRSELVMRLLDEGVRREQHPLLDFRWVDGERRPHIGNVDAAMLLVELRAHRGDVATAANVLQIEPRIVDAAVAYFQDFQRDMHPLMQREMRRRVTAREAREHTKRLLDEMASSPDAPAAG